MNNSNYKEGCGCNEHTHCGWDHGAGVVPGPAISSNCGKINQCGLFNTEVLPVSAGTDAEGQPFAPKFGAYHNTIVQYLANGAVYFYDSKGIWTKIVENGNFTNILEQLNNEITARQNADAGLQERITQVQQAMTQTAEMLQTNINQLYNKEAEDIANLQTNINAEVERATKAEEALSKGLNDENKRAYEAERELQQKIENVDNQLSDKQDTLVGEGEGQNIKTINGQSILGEGDIEIASGTGEGGSTSAPTATYTADNVNLVYPSATVELTPAVGSADGKVSQAGIMSAFQASQLEALAAAYEAEEKGTVLYEGTASVNNIELSESGLSYDHLIIVAQYMGMGSFALEQQVSEVFYPTDSVKAFQMNATDITTGNTPMVQLIQDIWSITDDGMEIELASSLKATVNSETTVEPDTTSNFTITKVVGFGKKLAES